MFGKPVLCIVGRLSAPSTWGALEGCPGPSGCRSVARPKARGYIHQGIAYGSWAGTMTLALCPKCGRPADESLRLCPTCGKDLGCPNVRAANSFVESEALAERARSARSHAASRGVVSEFDRLLVAVQQHSHVVVAMPSLYARSFLLDARALYAGYEALVGTPARTPAPFAHDSKRWSVSGKLFGSYAAEIRYGVLSLNGKGLLNYGAVFVQLHDYAVEDRVSFLQDNSYTFVADIRGADSLPPGFRSDWARRGELAATKLEPTLTPGSALSDWSQQLVVSGETRENDQCVEAHIYGPFNADAINTVVLAGNGASRDERLDMESIREHLGTRCRTVGGA